MSKKSDRVGYPDYEESAMYQFPDYPKPTQAFAPVAHLQLWKEDAIEAARYYEDNTFCAVVTDPPYDLGMDTWDCGFPAAVYWSELLRVIKPGGYLLAFGYPRTAHHLANLIEEAGFEIHDTIYWIHAEGFPKSFDLGKNSAKLRGYKTGLKPAVEPIFLAMKPRQGTYLENFEKWGVGGLNIDGCRVPSGEPIIINKLEQWSGLGEVKQPGYEKTLNYDGRYPANLILDDYAAETLGDPARFFYQAKAKFSEREEGLIGRIPCIVCGELNSTHHLINDKRIRCQRNDHKTVKPLELMRYLCRLVRPPDGGWIFDPFMGSGTTGKGALQEGLSFAGSETNEHIFTIAHARIYAEWEIAKTLGIDYFLQKSPPESS